MYFPDVLQPETVAKRINGFWFNNREELVSFNSVLEMISHQTLFLKIASDSCGGSGVKLLNEISRSELESEINKCGTRDIILQKRIQQSSILGGESFFSKYCSRYVIYKAKW